MNSLRIKTRGDDPPNVNYVRNKHDSRDHGQSAAGFLYLSRKEKEKGPKEVKQD